MNALRVAATEGSSAALDVATLRNFLARLGDELEGDDLLRQVGALEEVKNAICARQARATVELHRRQRTRDAERGIDAATTARFVGSQAALAQRRSPHLGSRLLGLAHALVEEMPHTYQALATGVISEWDATGLVQETACLSRDDRGIVDAALSDDLGHTSHRTLVAEARRHAYQADPEAFVARRARAAAERRVSLRPAPDCMSYLTALLAVKDGVACYAALRAAAASHSDEPQGQVMADTLVERVIGRTPADGGVDVHIDLLMPLDTLTDDTAAHVPDYGPIPADLAREWATSGEGDADGPGFQLRRIFSYPGTGDLVGMESRARTYPGLLSHFIKLRDQTCRTPFCDAPIKQTDHIRSHSRGGGTSERNGAGLCARAAIMSRNTPT